jgi:hypothetical protein
LKVDADQLAEQVRYTAEYLERNQERYREGRGQGGQADQAGYGLMALAAGGHARDAITDAVAEYFLRYQGEQPAWKRLGNRPPSGSSNFTTTYVALASLRNYGTPEQRERIAQRTARAEEWLLSTPARSTEDLVFRLRALHLLDRPEQHEARQDLIRQQRADGGWGDAADRPTEAYSTATALAALHSTGLASDDPVYRRGVRFLLDQRQADGTWHVKSYTKPVQPNFDSGFPHGKDQFLSITATAWAILALLPVIEPAS